MLVFTWQEHPPGRDGLDHLTHSVPENKRRSRQGVRQAQVRVSSPRGTNLSDVAKVTGSRDEDWRPGAGKFCYECQAVVDRWTGRVLRDDIVKSCRNLLLVVDSAIRRVKLEAGSIQYQTVNG